MSSNILMMFCLVGLAVCLTAIIAIIVAPHAKKSVGGVVFALAAVGLMLWAGDKPTPPPPVIVVKDIEIKSYECDHTGCRMTWACGTNITVGVDKFVIQRSTRQIPARTGWGQFEDYGETMTTNFATATPQHVSDVRWKIITRKEAN